jgi:multiple sugar transport system permease protein
MIGKPSAIEYPRTRPQATGWLGRLRNMNRDRLEQMVVGYLFILPDVLGLLVFIVGPMLLSVYISLSNWKLVGQPTFVGLRNYQAIAVDPLFGDSLGRTLLYTIGYVPTVYCLSLGLAVVLARRSRATGFFRTVYFMPVAMSLVISGVIWRFMLEPGHGLINTLLGSIGLPTPEWAGNVQSAMVAVLIVAIWKNAGYFMIILLAGIEDVPSDFIEAAQVDGANRWQAFRYIVLPLLKPISFFVVVILTIGSLQTFDQIYVMTRGGPAYATYTLLMYIYEKAFREWNFGYSAAMSVVLFAMIFILTLIQVRYFRSGGEKQ